MNLEALIAEFRLRRDDTVVPHDWSDEEIVSYINEAITEACERARLIEDRTTPAVCRIALSIDKASYTLHPSVLKVKRVAYSGQTLPETSVEAMDEADPQWESKEGAEPKLFILENDTGLRVYPVPTAAGTLTLTVYRDQLAPLSIDKPDGCPEIHARYHPRLLHWAYRCALLKRDSVTYNPEGAAAEESVFVRHFGSHPDANVTRKQRDRRPPIVKSSWPS